MTASSAPDPAALLDELAALREAATPGPWAQQRGAPNLVYGDPDAGIFVCNTGYDHIGLSEDGLPAADAALIVAAVNALPGLVDAVRAVLGLHVPTAGGDWCEHCESMATYREALWPCATVRAITAALAGEPQP